MSGQTSPLLIKRYASRRLYNTESSDYITLQEIADTIRAGRDVRIIDRKTGDDLTRQYLVQIIAEHESRGEQVLPLDVLTEIVRTCNDQTGDAVPRFLEMSFRMLKESQASVMESVQAMSDPRHVWGEFEKRQKEFAAAFIGGWTGKAQGDDDSGKTQADTGSQSELDTIKKQLAELQSRVSNL